MSTQPQPSEKSPPCWVWRRADQAALAILTLSAIVALTAYWVVQGGWQGRLIELDRQPKREVKFLVDVNQAEWPELAQLPAIGEGLARRIVEERTERGPYRHPQDLRRVRGIGPKTLERIRPYLLPLPPVAELAGQ